MADGPRAPLPAVYESPWRLLARDLRAVAASLRLALQERWRRQPWLVALLALVLVVASVVLLRLTAAEAPSAQRSSVPEATSARPFSARPPAADLLPESAASEDSAPQRPASQPTGSAPSASSGSAGSASASSGSESTGSVSSALENPASRGARSAGPASGPPGEPPAPSLRTAGAPESRPQPTTAPGASEPDGQAAAPASPPHEGPNPLLQVLAEGRPAGLLQAVSPRAAEGRLRLQLAGAAWASLPAAQRQQLAEGWRQQALALGYERLELADERNGPLGQTARVGSGMILLEPLPRR